MSIPPLEIDDRYFVILAQAPGIALTQHRITGRFAIWRLDWRCSGANSTYDQPADAWQQYMKEAI